MMKFLFLIILVVLVVILTLNNFRTSLQKKEANRYDIDAKTNQMKKIVK